MPVVAWRTGRCGTCKAHGSGTRGPPAATQLGAAVLPPFRPCAASARRALPTSRPHTLPLLQIGVPVMLDSGTNSLELPSTVLTAYYAAVKTAAAAAPGVRWVMSDPPTLSAATPDAALAAVPPLTLNLQGGAAGGRWGAAAVNVRQGAIAVFRGGVPARARVEAGALPPPVAPPAAHTRRPVLLLHCAVEISTLAIVTVVTVPGTGVVVSATGLEPTSAGDHSILGVSEGEGAAVLSWGGGAAEWQWTALPARSAVEPAAAANQMPLPTGASLPLLPRLHSCLPLWGASFRSTTPPALQPSRGCWALAAARRWTWRTRPSRARPSACTVTATATSGELGLSSLQRRASLPCLLPPTGEMLKAYALPGMPHAAIPSTPAAALPGEEAWLAAEGSACVGCCATPLPRPRSRRHALMPAPPCSAAPLQQAGIQAEPQAQLRAQAAPQLQELTSHWSSVFCIRSIPCIESLLPVCYPRN